MFKGSYRFLSGMLYNGLCLGLFLGLCLNSQAVQASWVENGAGISKDVPYVPTPQPVVDRMLRMAGVGPGDVVYDLGCGDGRIVITAVKDFGAARGVGIDIDPHLVEKSKGNARLAGVDQQIEFLVQDLFQSDFREASVVTLYLLSTVNLRLRPTLLSDLAPGTRVVSHAFDMGAWEPDDEGVENGNLVYFWVVPANVSGQWRLTQADGQTMDIVLEQEFQFVQGSSTLDSQRGQLQDVRLKGDQLEFTLEQEIEGTPTAVRYAGQVTGDTMAGSVSASDNQTWQATRLPDTEHPLEPSDAAYAEQRRKLLNLIRQ